MNPEQPSEVEALWLANEAFAELHYQHMSGSNLDPAAIEQFSTNRVAYDVVGSRVVAELAETAPERESKELQAVTLATLRETRRDKEESEGDICLRALGKLIETDEIPSYTQRLKKLETSTDVELSNLCQQNDQIAALVLLKRRERLVDARIARLMTARLQESQDIEDLKQIGAYSFLENAKKWNPDKGESLVTHSYQGTRREMLKWLETENHSVQLTDQTGAWAAWLMVVNAARKLAEEPPLTDSEIAKTLNIPFDAPDHNHSVRLLRRAVQLTYFIESLEDVTASDSLASTSIEETSDFALLTTREQPKDPAEVTTDKACKSAIETVLATLGNEREVEVIRLHYGLDGDTPKTLQEIATNYKLSIERIRQIRNKALHKLRYPFRSGMLRDFVK